MSKTSWKIHKTMVGEWGVPAHEFWWSQYIKHSIEVQPISSSISYKPTYPQGHGSKSTGPSTDVFCFSCINYPSNVPCVHNQPSNSWGTQWLGPRPIPTFFAACARSRCFFRTPWRGIVRDPCATHGFAVHQGIGNVGRTKMPMDMQISMANEGWLYGMFLCWWRN